jgi:hypothetical protein
VLAAFIVDIPCPPTLPFMAVGAGYGYDLPVNIADGLRPSVFDAGASIAAAAT